MQALASELVHRQQLMTSLMLALTIVSGVAIAQSGPATATRSGTQILLLGTSGGPPLRKERSEPSSLLIVDGHQCLIDCGIGAMRQMVLAGIQSETIETIFITHHHPDHDLGLADIMANDFFRLDVTGATRTINIYGPPQTEELVKAAFKYISIPFGVFAAEGLPGAANLRSANTTLLNPFAAHDVQHSGVVYEDQNLRVIAAENSHYALMPEQLRTYMKSYCYRFETPHGVVVFSGDTGPSDELEQLAHEADVLMVEGGVHGARPGIDETHLQPETRKQFQAHQNLEHLHVEEVGMLASKAQVRSVLLYHQGIAADTIEPAARISGVKKYFPGPVFVGADMERYCLGQQADKYTGSPILSLCH